MPKITIINLSHQSIDIIPANLGQPIITYIHNASIDWMHSCGKKGRCTTCKMSVLDGMEHLNALTACEKKYMDNRRLHSHERLACQAMLVKHGDLLIHVPKEECQLPHLHYTD